MQTALTPSRMFESPIDDSAAQGTGRTLDIPTSDAAVGRLWAFWDGGSQSFPLPPMGAVTIGRLSSCPIRINHASISRRHATLELTPLPHVSDMGSANGTRVGGRTIDPHVFVPIDVGEVIEVGAVLLAISGGSSSMRRGEEAMQRVERMVRLVASAHSTVLLLGERGSGKEHVGRRIHANSRRANQPFVRIDSRFVTETTDFDVREGTFLLAEVGDLPAAAQARLVEILDRPNRDVATAGRFIATSSRDLRALVLAGDFREDLYRLLGGLAIELPPLRERRSDIVDLAKSILAKICQDHGRPPLALGREAVARIRTYDWPGNIRELREVLERAALASHGDSLDVQRLPGDGPDIGLRKNIAVYERQRIVEALESCQGNQTKAAKVLGIARRTLVAKLAAFDIPRPRCESRR